MRVFVAMDVPEETRQALAELIAGLGKIHTGARWVRTEGIHVTLKFIGEAAPEKVEAIETSLCGIHSSSPVDLAFRRIGFFPSQRHPRVFWAGIEASPNLAELAASIESRLEPLGIPRENRPFHPHLTLARFQSEDGLAKLHESLARLGALDFGATRASEFYLYQSVLKRGGAEYTRLAKFPFVESAR